MIDISEHLFSRKINCSMYCHEKELGLLQFLIESSKLELLIKNYFLLIRIDFLFENFCKKKEIICLKSS